MIIIEKINYIIVILIFSLGLYIITSEENFFKKILGLSLIQNSIILFFVSYGKILKGKVPILKCLDYLKCPETYSNPLLHILMLTAIVVGFVTNSVACALLIKIRENSASLTIDNSNKVQKIDEY